MGNLTDYVSTSVFKKVFMLQIIDLVAEYSMPFTLFYI